MTDVYERQDKIIENRDQLEVLLVRAHLEAGKAWELGAGEAEMEEILQGIRHSQWRWDYAAASHGASFHAPVETGRIISTAIAIVQETRIKLARLLASRGFNEELPYPDISSKAKAQHFIGLDMKTLNQNKQEFMLTVVPEWQKQARERENAWNTEQEERD